MCFCTFQFLLYQYVMFLSICLSLVIAKSGLEVGRCSTSYSKVPAERTKGLKKKCQICDWFKESLKLFRYQICTQLLNSYEKPCLCFCFSLDGN